MQIFLLLFVLFFTLIPSVEAHTFPNNTLSVSPSLVQLDLQQDKPQTVLSYTNTTPDTLELAFSASNFTELENGWNLTFLESKNAQNYKYGLASWITFDKKSLVLLPQETGNVTVFINPVELSPGGHYGSILAHVIHSTNPGDVAINSVMATMLFVRTHTGKEIEQGFIQYFTSPENFFDFPNTYVMRFENTGNVDVTPYGVLTVTDAFGRIIARGIVDQGSLLSFPQSIRRYDIPVKTLTSFIFPGKYIATVTIEYGKSQKHVTASRTFFSQGSIPLFPLTLIIMLCGGGYGYYLLRNRVKALTMANKNI